ncbi:hypothetical protein C2W62_33340 [Candidatus Entotheonella serta]|nr:hypothetical protein C2W62_33340 [Candidatus Entotheonella serta]
MKLTAPPCSIRRPRHQSWSITARFCCFKAAMTKPSPPPNAPYRTRAMTGRLWPHTNIGLAYLKKAALARAADHFRTALDYQPALPEAHLNLGLVHARSGAYGEAILSFREAIRTRPFYPEAYVSLAQLLLEEGRREEARDAFERVIDLAPDSTFAVASRRELRRLTP